MKSTARNLRLLLVLLAMCLPGCKHGSTLPSNGQTIKPQPVRVSCKQKDTTVIAKAPRKDEWVLGGQLSERAANWIAEVLGVADTRKTLLTKEQGCLDDAEKKGLIQQ